MKSLCISFIIFLAFVFSSAAQTESQTDTLTVLHFNDSHSCLAPLGPRNTGLEGSQGGIARAATLIGMTKMTESNVLTLHSGDMFIGDLFFNNYFGVASFQLWNAIGLDAMTLGNHEFDLTPSTLLAALQNSFAPPDGFDILSANMVLLDPSVAGLSDYVKNTVIYDVNGIKVGLFGLTTPETNLFSQALPEVFLDTNLIQISVDMVTQLSSQNCDVIILLSHLGSELDQLIAGNIPGIDLIIGGHDHYTLNEPISVPNPLGGITRVFQASSFLKYGGKIRLEIGNGQVNYLGSQLIPLDSTIPEEPTVKAEVESLIAGIEALYGPMYTQQVGFAAGFFDEEADSLIYIGDHGTQVGLLLSEAFKSKTGTDIGITVGGSTSQPIYEGPLTAADLFRCIGYGFNEINGLGFRICTFELTGLQLIMSLEITLSMIEKNDEFFPQVAGMEFRYNPSHPVYSRITGVLVNGNPVEPGTTYSITSNEFLAAVLQDFFSITPSNFFLYDSLTEFEVLLEYVVSQGVITPSFPGSAWAVPVELTSFEAVHVLNCISLEWTTATETNNKGFRIERKFDGEEWTEIAFVEGKGSSTQEQHYLYTDDLSAINYSGLIHYRLKQIDFNGTYEFLDEISVRYDPGDIDFRLSQNYPNPFNPSTKINYQIPMTTHVELSVFNIIGEKVAVLTDAPLEAGAYEIEFNPTGLSSGVYLYVLKAGNFIESKKMIFIK